MGSAVATDERVVSITNRSAGTRTRLDSVDLLRGLVMVIMALDHVRDYFSNSLIDPVNLQKTDAALFLTRWITHYCAPTFVFLAGTGALLFGARGRTKRELAWFLFSRGLWLVFLDVTVVRLGWSFNFEYAREFGGGIIWAIGWAMVILSGLVFLPLSAVTTIGVALVAFHNLLDSTHAADFHLPEGLWLILHQPGGFLLIPEMTLGSVHVPAIHFGTGYSLLPWLGVMAAGYGLGALLLLERSERRKQLLGLGLTLIVLFIGLRWLNLYGDAASRDPRGLGAAGPGPWSPQQNWLFTLFSFVNCQKYPPSLLYILMTLGPAITALAIFDREAGPLGRFFITFGRVPLFYYVLHIPLIHGLVVLNDKIRFGWSPYLHSAPWTLERQQAPETYGYGLPMVYLIWIGVVLLLYLPCRWFADVKRRHRAAWLSYL
jgi:uncharacterized membrane protein